MKNKNSDEILHHIRLVGYIMTNKDTELKLCDEMETQGILLRADKAGKRNPVGTFNPSYTYIMK